MSRSAESAPFLKRLTLVLSAGVLFRLVYVVLQRVTDPLWGATMLDGTLYLDWANRIGWGDWGVDGAFYLAPLYPLFLAGFEGLFGENWVVLLLVQQSFVVVAAGLGAVWVRRVAGDLAALLGAGLLLLHHPLIFFASKLACESLAVVLALAALSALPHEAKHWTSRHVLISGLFAGLATLARPNLLLLPAIWFAWALAHGRWRQACLLVGTVALVLTPTTVRNAVVSGHFVPVSSNAGMTFFHGNAPGASGIFTFPREISGAPATQRAEATAVARHHSGIDDLDPVEADRWWGRQALEARWKDPLDTLKLLRRRAWLTIGSHEVGLDEHPSLDRNPIRATFRSLGGELPWIPFGLLLGLTAAGVAVGERRAWGGSLLACSLVACAATPLIFYMSSRYRLPLAGFLAISAGCGLAALVRLARARDWPRFAPAVLLAFALTVLSLFSPGEALRNLQSATANGNVASVLRRIGNLSEAQAFAERAVRLNPSSPAHWFGLARVFELRGEKVQAINSYREALSHDPGFVQASRNLGVLWMEAGRWDESARVSRAALVYNPRDEACHTHRVVALALKGDRTAAEAAVLDAAAVGVVVPAEVLESAWTDWKARSDSGPEE